MGALLLTWSVHAAGQTPAPTWTERETRLANEYLSLLVQQPEHGRVLDLLWSLYDKHEATKLLVENVSRQAAASKHPAVMLVHGHLLRRGGDLAGAAGKYDEVLKLDAGNVFALRGRAEVAVEQKQPEAAIALLKRLAVVLKEGGGDVWIEIGNLALGGGKNAEAADAWEAAAKLRADDFGLARQVAQLLLQAGFPDRAAAFFAKLADQKDPQRKLDALYDLARIYEHADQFAKADAALRDGLAMLHFRDGRYVDFFRRRVRLHERFGLLDDLREALVKAAKKAPPAEQAMLDAARFFEITVEVEERVVWLQALVKAVPQVEDYRWELVRTLLDHEGTAEAAALLDERLKGDGSDLPAIVLLRCEADLRSGDAESATRRLEKLLDVQSGTDVEKQLLVFAQNRALDAVVERILRARVAREPQKAEAVFDLAAFFRARRNPAAEDQLLREFTASATSEEEKQRRLNDASAFLAAGSNIESAIALAREAVSKPGAGREAWLRLAELLAEHGENGEAAEWVEKAWQASTTDEDRVDADERLLSILMGDEKPAVKPLDPTFEFKLPAAFTGSGFASDAPAGPSAEGLPTRVTEFAGKAVSAARQDGAGLPEVFRGFWWTLRTNQIESAYDLLDVLEFDPRSGKERAVSLIVKQLKLDLAQVDENVPLMMRQLRLLAQIDAASRVRHTLRLAELLMEAERRAESEYSNPGWKSDAPPRPPGADAAKLLESVYREFPDSGPLLSALTQVYFLQRRTDDALALWKEAVKRVEGPAALPLLESYADILLRQHRIGEHVEVQAQILERETDIKRRREVLRRCIDRLTFSDANGGELAPSVLRDRLKLLEQALTSRVQRHPFDGFYHEALAEVFERGGEHARAFASMKQAYYTAPDTPFSLDQLRDAALKVDDLKAAIYFQKQIAAAAPRKEMAAESRRLVELLEQTFEIAEADRVRRRLESRFSQDAGALEELAKYYQTTGQDEAERRVYEQMARVRAWDGRARLRLALKCLRFADDAEAEKHLNAVLTVKMKAGSYPVKGVRAPLPLTDTRRGGSGVTTGDLAPLLDFAPGLERKEMDQLRAFLGQPRAEFAELPDDAAIVRLRAVEELAKLHRARGGATLSAWVRRWSADAEANAVEKLWALYYADAGSECRAVLAEVLPDVNTLEAQFCHVWLHLRSGGMREVTRWAGEKGWSAEVLKARSELLYASASMLTDVAEFRYRTEELKVLGEARVLRNSAIIDLTRKLADKQRYDEALALGEPLPRHSPEMSLEFSHFLARIAESAERWDLARHYLESAVSGPATGGAYRTAYDPFLLSVSALHRVADSGAKREDALRSVWRRLQRAQPSAMTAIHKAAVAGLAGADGAGGEMLGRFLSGPFIAQREVADPGGGMMSQGASRYQEPNHMRTLWEETREVEALLYQQGLGGVVRGANQELDARFGTTMLGPRSDSEFGEWRINELLGRLRDKDYPTRLRMIREHLAAVDLRTEHSVETLANLASRLETAGMVREAISLYSELPDRAPSNPDYALWMLRSCENAREIEPGLSFALKLLMAEPPYKPPQPGDDTLREKHAMFLAWDFNVDELRRRGFRDKFSQVLERRRPHEISYLRELGLLLERLQDDRGALSAWERMHAAYVANDQAGTDLDAESGLHRGQILLRLGQPKAALKVLAEVPTEEPLDPVAEDALKLRCEIASSLTDAAADGLRDLMALCVERRSLRCIIALASGLRKEGRSGEALNLLIHADRTLKGDHERFTLRLEMLKVLTLADDWTPERGRSQIAALLRTTTRDRETLQDMHAWLRDQAAGRHAGGWISILATECRAGADRPLAALALSAFAGHLGGEAHEDFLEAWKKVAEQDRICIELAAEALLGADRAAWAGDACRILASVPTLREQGRKLPLAVRVAHAQKDEAAIRELFNDTLRLAFPGGAQTIEWARAFEDAGHADLAAELFAAAMQRIDGSAAQQPEIFAAHARFLIRQQQFEAAEAFLMRRNWCMPQESAKLVFELYQSWGMVPGIERELPKFRLPGAVRSEVLFLARQSAKHSPSP